MTAVTCFLTVIKKGHKIELSHLMICLMIATSYNQIFRVSLWSSVKNSLYINEEEEERERKEKLGMD